MSLSRRRNFSVYRLLAAGYHADARAHGWPAAVERHGETRIDAVCASGDSPEEGVDLTALTSKLGLPTSCYVYYTLYENCASVGETAVKNCGRGGKCYDEDVVPLLDDALAKYTSGYKLVVLHLGGGSHGRRYADRHPPEFQQFKPMCNDADVVSRCTPTRCSLPTTTASFA